jgi:zinc/manganese transport system ATP-binding protein
MIPPRGVAAADPVLRFHDVTLGYGGAPALEHLVGTVARGALIAVVGPNGAGKSTLLKGVAGELRPLSGTIEWCGAKPREIAVMPQQAAIDRSFPISVFDMVSAGLWRGVGARRAFGPVRRRAIADALGTVGLDGLGRRPIGALSGGQFQRALFARLMLQDAPLVLLDEPFAAIDHHTVGDLIALVRAWHEEGRTILAALHDLEQVRTTFPETLLLAGRPIAWGPTAEVLTEANLIAAQSIGCRHPGAEGEGRAAAAGGWR